MTEAQVAAVRRVIAEMRSRAEQADEHATLLQYTDLGAYWQGLRDQARRCVTLLETALGEAEPVNPLTSPSNR